MRGSGEVGGGVIAIDSLGVGGFQVVFFLFKRFIPKHLKCSSDTDVLHLQLIVPSGADLKTCFTVGAVLRCRR